MTKWNVVCRYDCPFSLATDNISSDAQAPVYISGVLGATQAEIEQHLEMGRKLLAAGQLAEALSHYHSAVGKITCRHTQWHTFIVTLQADIFIILCLCSTIACPPLYLHKALTLLFQNPRQRETLRITWPSTSELRCSWRWENPNLLCQTWPEPSSSSLTSWLWVHLIMFPPLRLLLIFSVSSFQRVSSCFCTFRPGCREETSC